ncbi:metallo-mystery pair system four-Cys motif protein [Bradymonadaceae bacterium TMQ3]|nr:metallo-mystery pair system four-Cys motif protein [Bradymonadaceae bacterium TMQ3]TXC75007.1 metallo-mystery pair system four-Cys motif protein [Bradymonadales bacterium TMQ1]
MQCRAKRNNGDEPMVMRRQATFMKCSTYLSAVLGVAMLAGGCSEGVDEPDGDGQSTPVELRFRMVDAQGQDFRCGETGLELAGLNDVTPNDARLYLHDFHLITTAGELVPVALDPSSEWQHEGVVLLDFEDATEGCEFVIFGRPQTAQTNALVRGVAESQGPFEGVTFRLGVPIELNHIEAQSAPAPLNVTGMEHGQSAGRQFIRVAFYQEAQVNSPSYHLLSFRSVCDEAVIEGQAPDDARDCLKPNRADYRLSSQGFDPGEAEILIDLGELFSGYDVSQAGDDAQGFNAEGRVDCFSPLHAGDLPGGEEQAASIGAERCGRFYNPLGLDYESGRPQQGVTQSVFRIAE